jgi:hypothetical protein
VCAEDFLSLGALGILDLLVVEEADLWRKVQKPIPVVLHRVSLPSPRYPSQVNAPPCSSQDYPPETQKSTS